MQRVSPPINDHDVNVLAETFVEALSDPRGEEDRDAVIASLKEKPGKTRPFLRQAITANATARQVPSEEVADYVHRMESAIIARCLKLLEAEPVLAQ